MINIDQFMRFEKVRMSGAVNMRDKGKVADMANMTRKDVEEIEDNYDRLKLKFQSRYNYDRNF